VYQENKLKPDILKFQEDTPTFAADLHRLLMCQPLVAVSDKREDITQNANTTNLKTWGGGQANQSITDRLFWLMIQIYTLHLVVVKKTKLMNTLIFY
jgi:hypothetical protein